MSYITYINNGEQMKTGDLVKTYGKLGIVLHQMGVTDRWMILWDCGEKYALNGYNLFLVTL